MKMVKSDIAKIVVVDRQLILLIFDFFNNKQTYRWSDVALRKSIICIINIIFKWLEKPGLWSLHDAVADTQDYYF